MGALALGTLPGDRSRLGQDMGPQWAQLSRAHGRPGQGCRELETGPVLASLGQGLMAREGDMGSWALGRAGGAPQAGQGQAGLGVPPGPGHWGCTLQTVVIPQCYPKRPPDWQFKGSPGDTGATKTLNCQ